MLLSELFAQKNLLVINRYFVKYFNKKYKNGTNIALYFLELLNKRFEYWQDEFCFSQVELEESLWLSVDIQREALKILIDEKFVKVVKKWIPAKYWFKIDDASVMGLSQDKCSDNPSTSDGIFPGLYNSINNNILYKYINNNILLNNNIITTEWTDSLSEWEKRKKIKKEKSPAAETPKFSNEEYDKFVSQIFNFWNSQKASDKFWKWLREINSDIRLILVKAINKYWTANIEIGIKKYKQEIKTRNPQGSYAAHRFTLKEFFKQWNWLDKFYNID